MGKDIRQALVAAGLATEEDVERAKQQVDEERERRRKRCDKLTKELLVARTMRDSKYAGVLALRDEIAARQKLLDAITKAGGWLGCQAQAEGIAVAEGMLRRVEAQFVTRQEAVTCLERALEDLEQEDI